MIHGLLPPPTIYTIIRTIKSTARSTSSSRRHMYNNNDKQQPQPPPPQPQPQPQAKKVLQMNQFQ